jgi:regulator of PEP synthase PpsR (kinase-PPPase family)
MSETKAPTAVKEQEAETGAAKTHIPDLPEIQKTKAVEDDGEETGKTRQRFFSQTEVNRIVKREIERALKTSKLPELETAQARVGELETQLRKRELRELVAEAGTKAGAKKTQLLFRAVEEKLELDDKGKPKNLDEVIKDARRDYPELFSPASRGNANGGAGQQVNARPSMNELLRRNR